MRGHIDTAQVNLGKDKCYLSVAIDRAIYALGYPLRLSGTARQQGHGHRHGLPGGRLGAMPVLGNCSCVALPPASMQSKVEKILTDNGMAFSHNPLAENKKPKGKEHPSAALCKARQIEHRTTLVKHPWANGMVEAMDKKVKANTTQRFHYDSVEQLKTHLYHYGLNYNFNLKLRAVGRKTPFEAILKWYDEKPEIFIINPNHLYVGLNR